MNQGNLKYNETDTEVTRYTLAYPELPAEIANAINHDNTEIPDYSNASLDELDDDYDATQANLGRESNSKYHVSGYKRQGGYDAELDWNANRTRLVHDSYFTQNALYRRAMIGGLKGAALGAILGSGASLLAIRYMTITYKLPISFHVYTIGGGVLMFGGMNSVHQAKRYKEYIGFKQTGISNPEMIGLKDAKNQMADWIASAYSRTICSIHLINCVMILCVNK